MDNAEKVREIQRELLDAEKRVEALRWELRRLVEEELRDLQQTYERRPSRN